MNIAYPILTSEIAKRGIKKCAISDAIGVSYKAFSNKMSGKVPFTWPEVCEIKNTFFPDMEKDVLFSPTDQVDVRSGA